MENNSFFFFALVSMIWAKEAVERKKLKSPRHLNPATTL